MKQHNLITLIDHLAAKSNQFLQVSLKEHDLESLASSHIAILIHLMNHTELTMKALSELIYRDKSTITPLINKLILLGYVIKLQDNQDKRVFKVSITQQGLKLKTIIEKIGKIFQEQATSSLSNSEHQSLLRLLRKVEQVL